MLIHGALVWRQLIQSTLLQCNTVTAFSFNTWIVLLFTPSLSPLPPTHTHPLPCGKQASNSLHKCSSSSRLAAARIDVRVVEKWTAAPSTHLIRAMAIQWVAPWWWGLVVVGGRREEGWKSLWGGVQQWAAAEPFLPLDVVTQRCSWFQRRQQSSVWLTPQTGVLNT